MAPRTVRFDTSAALLAWMEDEALTELTISDLTPEPATETPSDVRFTWWLHGVGNEKRIPFRVHAREVSRYTLDGSYAESEVTIPVGGLPLSDAPGIQLAMRVPGRLELACKSIEIARGKPQGKAVVRSYVDYAYFVVNGSARVSLATLLEALGAPHGARIVDRDPALLATTFIDALGIGPIDVKVGSASWIKIFALKAANPGDYALSISRGAVTDAEWQRAQELPLRVKATSVESAWEFSGTPAQWARAVGLAIS